MTGWRLLDVVTDEKTGRISTTKVWMHIAYAIASVVVVRHPEVSAELLLVYMATVGGSFVATYAIKKRYGHGSEDTGLDNK